MHHTFIPAVPSDWNSLSSHIHQESLYHSELINGDSNDIISVKYSFSLKINYLQLGAGVSHAVYLATWEAEIRGLWLEASLDW
jgi:hypothetical protein